ncbi:MAG: hypothetical protein ACE5EK_02825 [Nitrospinales bacterium]
MTQDQTILDALTRPDNLKFAINVEEASTLKDQWNRLKKIELDGSAYWCEGDRPTLANTRVKVYPTGHIVFYNRDGRRFLLTDPTGHPLHECEWDIDEATGEASLVHARIQLDCRQWVGIKPDAKTFSTHIDIKGQPGWENMQLDDLRKQAAEAWRVPFSQVKYFYGDKNFISHGDGKYEINLLKDGLYVLTAGSFDQKMFISFMFSVNWGRLDSIPVVELFQSALPGSGGAAFELIWGLYEDQSRENPLPPLRYRGLPTYPSPEAFAIFTAFFDPKGPEGEDIMDVFMNTDRSHEIEWTPRADPPWRYFSDEHSVCLTVQDHFLYKVSAFDDPVGIPYINCSRGGRPSCERQLQVRENSIHLLDGKESRDIPLDPRWHVSSAKGEEAVTQPTYPFSWRKFFNGQPPKADPVKMIFTLPFYPEGKEEIQESSLQPMVIDQIFYYMENQPDMPAKLEKIDRVLIHTFDTVISGCVDCTRQRDYTVLYSDPEFAQKNAQLLWNHAAAIDQLKGVSKVSFLLEAEHVDAAYKEKYGMIFKWIPTIFYQDRENCEAMLKAAVDALNPGGLLFLVGPKPILGLFEHYSLTPLKHDPVIDMPFFRQHLKMCPENFINPEITVFLAERK